MWSEMEVDNLKHLSYFEGSPATLEIVQNKS